MITFTTLHDALQAGYHVIGATQQGYVVRLVQANGLESWGQVVIAQR